MEDFRMQALPERHSTTDMQKQLEDLLDRWEDAVTRGESPQLDEICADYPELKAEVGRQVRALEQMRAALETPTAGPGTADDTKPALQLTTRFRDLTLHAQGGLGRVYRGTGVEVRREVAIKFLKRRHSSYPGALQQFLAEAEITSRLDHPGIVPVLGLGQTEVGEYFYVMRLIQGQELEEAIRKFHEPGPPSDERFESMEFRDLVQRIVSACKTIAYAHSRGILHLDIKPKNIMLGRYGDTIVVDWGCAAFVTRSAEFRRQDEQSLRPEMAPGLSSHGAGTPAYMSPEQFGRTAPLTPASDIFNLGGTLYKLLTGRPPYADGRQVRPVEAGACVDCPRPHELVGSVPRELEAICLKSLAPYPGDRYKNALDLAADLECFLAGSPVSALPERIRDKASRWLRRHRYAALGTLTAMFVIVVASVTAASLFARLAKTETQARKSIEELQAATLSTSARYAADLFAREIESRWNLLQLAALDPELHERLSLATSAPADKDARFHLQAWLNGVFIENQELLANSWFLVDSKGTQLALSPAKNARTIDKNFAHRDYFHGQGRDLDPVADALVQHGPCKRPHVSTPYISENTGKLRIALTVPVWAKNNTDEMPIAVLGMSTEMGQFSMLKDAILVDLREDWLDDVSHRGLVLQHPAFDRSDDSAAGRNVHHRVDERLMQRLQELHAESSKSIQVVAVDPAFKDTLAGSNGSARRAAFAPVVIRFPGNEDDHDPGEHRFAIIVTENDRSANEKTPAPQ
jgi:serine/threonine protein kinase